MACLLGRYYDDDYLSFRRAYGGTESKCFIFLIMNLLTFYMAAGVIALIGVIWLILSDLSERKK